MKKIIRHFIKDICYWIFRHLPLEDKIVATSFKGKKYGDNPQYIFEELHRRNPMVKLVWLKDEHSHYKVPSYVKVVPYGTWLRCLNSLYELATAKVWVDTHRLQPYLKKRKGQVFVETWHGGLGIKKVEYDVPAFVGTEWLDKEIACTNNAADVYISQSEHLSGIYRRAFRYNGPIWKVGYPKSDMLFRNSELYKAKIYQHFEIDKGVKIILYAPSFRDYFYHGIDTSVYAVDYSRLIDALTKRFGGRWLVFTRWHPLFADQLIETKLPQGVINATDYPDMQELIMASDVLLSDYSSCIFDAALREIPCFTFATDFEQYKADRGVYYEMDELPFPYAKNNDELVRNILNFDEQDYANKWNAFKERTGLFETGHAAKDIAEKILEFISTGHVEWK